MSPCPHAMHPQRCFFSSRRRHTRCLSDWSSDVCSSDLDRLGSPAGDGLTWIESASPSFRARHDSAHRDDAAHVLHSLELARRDLAEWFPIDLAGLTVVLHSSTASLWAARPLLPVAWVATAP